MLSPCRDTTEEVPSNWSRLPGQMCKLPNTPLLNLPAGKMGCLVMSFSHDGRLANLMLFYLHHFKILKHRKQLSIAYCPNKNLIGFWYWQESLVKNTRSVVQVQTQALILRRASSHNCCFATSEIVFSPI